MLGLHIVRVPWDARQSRAEQGSIAVCSADGNGFCRLHDMPAAFDTRSDQGVPHNCPCPAFGPLCMIQAYVVAAHGLHLLPDERDGRLGPTVVGPGQRGISTRPAQEEARVRLGVNAMGKRPAFLPDCHL